MADRLLIWWRCMLGWACTQQADWWALHAGVGVHAADRLGESACWVYHWGQQSSQGQEAKVVSMPQFP